jgi:N4-(beta-N-acetylglucosaminyl)-L-asparaginase
MDGSSMKVGSVAYIRRYRKAISLARLVMNYTDHTLLVGDGAEAFADMLGLIDTAATTTVETKRQYQAWLSNSCQPNFYRNLPGCEASCPPYSAERGRLNTSSEHKSWASERDHDTIGMIVLSNNNEMACGTSTNGADHKIAGRVGDAPIVGSGCYVNGKYGGAAATGDGDIMMRS